MVIASWPRRIWILQITVYYKELLTINCQGTNHPRSILSFMDISILYPPHSWPLLSPVPSGPFATHLLTSSARFATLMLASVVRHFVSHSSGLRPTARKERV